MKGSECFNVENNSGLKNQVTAKAKIIVGEDRSSFP
jgi:hypothetical protein